MYEHKLELATELCNYK